MLLGDDRISHLSHLLVDAIVRENRIERLAENEKLLREIKRIIRQELRRDEELDEVVRAKLNSYSRPIPEGSPEWEVLYAKFLAEERRKQKM